jgi:DNA-binding MarR family transcriptional regulator
MDEIGVNQVVRQKAIATQASQAEWRGEGPRADEPLYELIELFFFAYRDFVGDADRLLENYGFGRAHHRVLHFVSRRPGLPIAALLDILKITKQSLNRVLKQLLDSGFVEARAGAQDRRQRLLYPTAKGARLAHELAQLQSERFSRVLNELRPDARATATEFLLTMINGDDRDGVRAHFLRSARAQSRASWGGAS